MRRKGSRNRIDSNRRIADLLRYEAVQSERKESWMFGDDDDDELDEVDQ